MGAHELDINRAKLVRHGHNQSIFIPVNVENNTVVPDKARAPVLILDLLWRFPGGLPCLVVPRLQRWSSVRMLGVERLEFGLGNHTHRRRIVPNWDMRKRCECCQTKNALQVTSPKDNFFICNYFGMPRFATKRAAIRSVVERHNASNARVFGSVVHGDDHEGSDLDILIDPTPKT